MWISLILFRNFQSWNLEQRVKLPFCFHIWTRDFLTRPSVCSQLLGSLHTCPGPCQHLPEVPSQRKHCAGLWHQRRGEKAGLGEGRRPALDSPVGGRLRGGLLPLLLEAELIGHLGAPVLCVSQDTVSRTQAPFGAPRRPRVTGCPSTTS